MKQQERFSETPQEACDHGNAHLREIGRAHELHWVIRNGKANLEWCQPLRPKFGSS